MNMPDDSSHDPDVGALSAPVLVSRTFDEMSAEVDALRADLVIQRQIIEKYRSAFDEEVAASGSLRAQLASTQSSNARLHANLARMVEIYRAVDCTCAHGIDIETAENVLAEEAPTEGNTVQLRELAKEVISLRARDIQQRLQLERIRDAFAHYSWKSVREDPEEEPAAWRALAQAINPRDGE